MDKIYESSLSDRECWELIIKLIAQLNKLGKHRKIALGGLTEFSSFLDKLDKRSGKRTKIDRWIDDRFKSPYPAIIYFMDVSNSDPNPKAFLISVKSGRITVSSGGGNLKEHFMAFCILLEQELSELRIMRQIGAELDGFVDNAEQENLENGILGSQAIRDSNSIEASLTAFQQEKLYYIRASRWEKHYNGVTYGRFIDSTPAPFVSDRYKDNGPTKSTYHEWIKELKVAAPGIDFDKWIKDGGPPQGYETKIGQKLEEFWKNF